MRAALVAIAAAASPAHADDHGRVPIMITDGICDAFMASVLTPVPDSAGVALFYAGLFTQVVAPPIIHGVDHEYGADWGLAGLDFGARVALPVVGFFVGNALCSPKKDVLLDCFDAAIAGGFVGVASAQVLDWLVLSRVTHEPLATPRIVSFGGRF